MTDWFAYDPIAGRYDDAWGSRFEAVAKLVWQSVPPARGASVLDIGTGTGILPHALGACAADPGIGVEEWERLLGRARDELGRRFGRRLSFSRGALIGVCRKV